MVAVTHVLYLALILFTMGLGAAALGRTRTRVVAGVVLMIGAAALALVVFARAWALVDGHVLALGAVVGAVITAIVGAALAAATPSGPWRTSARRLAPGISSLTRRRDEAVPGVLGVSSRKSAAEGPGEAPWGLSPRAAGDDDLGASSSSGDVRRAAPAEPAAARR